MAGDGEQRSLSGEGLRLLPHTSRSTAGTFYWGGRSSGLGSWPSALRLFSHLAVYRPQSFYGLNFSLSSVSCTDDRQAIWGESLPGEAALCTEHDTPRGPQLAPFLSGESLPAGHNRRIKCLAPGSWFTARHTSLRHFEGILLSG